MSSKLIPPRIPLVDARSGLLAREWYLWFLSLADETGVNLDPDQFAILPVDASLAARVAALEAQIDDLRKGTLVL